MAPERGSDKQTEFERRATCAGKSEYSRITQAEMKNFMKRAVDTVYRLLWLKKNDPNKSEATLEFGNRYTRFWDEPKTDVG
jgi:hypothetical protein